MKLGTPVLLDGTTQFVGCGLLAVALFWSIGYAGAFGTYGLLYLAVSTSLSSTLIVVKVLSDHLELDTLTSRVTLGILVIQDVWAITFLAIQPRMANLTAVALAISVGSALLLLAAGIGIARFALPTILRARVAASRRGPPPRSYIRFRKATLASAPWASLHRTRRPSRASIRAGQSNCRLRPFFSRYAIFGGLKCLNKHCCR